MNNRVKLPPLAPVTSDKQLVERVNTIVSALIPLVGQHSNKNERVVQWADLLSMGLVNVKGLSPDGYPDYGPPPAELPDMTTPPPLAGFRGAASFNFVTLSWDPPRYRNHAYVEIWRAAGFKKLPSGVQVPTVLTDAVFIMLTPSIVCSDSVLPADKWRYWARNISQTGVVGPWSSVDGLLMEVPEDPAYLIDKISGEIRQGDLWPALGNKIDIAYDGYYTNTSAITSQGQTLAAHTQTLASHGIAIQQQSSIITSQGALISAAWTVRIDSGNAVSGFGLMVDGATGRSDFIVRSDRFAISAPQAYDQDGKPVVNNNAFPFIVDVTNPASPKVLIKNAYIDQAFITNLVTGSLIADRITGQTITGTFIRGGDLSIGSNFSVDGAGNMVALNAFLRGTMQSSNYGAGVSGWSIHNNGNAEFNNAVLRGTIYATGGWFQGTVYADKLIGHVTAAAVKNCSLYDEISWVAGQEFPMFSFYVNSNGNKAGYLSVIGAYVPVRASSSSPIFDVVRAGGFVLCCRLSNGTEVVFSAANNDVTVALPAGFEGTVSFYYKASYTSGAFAHFVTPADLSSEEWNAVPYQVTGILTYNYGGLS